MKLRKGKPVELLNIPACQILLKISQYIVIIKMFQCKGKMCGYFKCNRLNVLVSTIRKQLTDY